MKENKLKLHPCYCGGEMEIKKVAQNGGMDGTYWDWELTCNKCGLTKTYAADGFYGRKYKTLEEVVDDWNKKKRGRTDVFDKIRAEIVDTLYVDSLIFGKLIDFRNGKISADDVIDEFNRVTRMEVLKIIDKYRAESEDNG